MPVGRLVTRATNDVENLAEMFSQGLVALITDVIKMIGFAVVLQQVTRPVTYDRLVFGYCVLIAIAQGVSASTRRSVDSTSTPTAAPR